MIIKRVKLYIDKDLRRRNKSTSFIDTTYMRELNKSPLNKEDELFAYLEVEQLTVKVKTAYIRDEATVSIGDILFMPNGKTAVRVKEVISEAS